ncbi:unnamed protein product [Arctogadus glacialis]
MPWLQVHGHAGPPCLLQECAAWPPLSRRGRLPTLAPRTDATMCLFYWAARPGGEEVGAGSRSGGRAEITAAAAGGLEVRGPLKALNKHRAQGRVPGTAGYSRLSLGQSEAPVQPGPRGAWSAGYRTSLRPERLA